MRSADNVIGDTTADGRNVIGGTDRAAIYVFSATAVRNKILGNYLGTDATGMVALGDHSGITIDTATDNTIGGVTAAARNVIGGMPLGPAISIITGSTRNVVTGTTSASARTESPRSRISPVCRSPMRRAIVSAARPRPSAT
ncbi:MAG: hypothetical protein IPJ04_17155 [Candidatus Eisenbacteria bacterium]|nr:hypothetical protein [Candidatus Eisenbacteria bacterium]